ncbi:MAG TPA: hypothetical protein GXZ87_05645, partial [Bacteroidales bacterium]|nr:hypothetical protein [Bacteroidales bacterium]
MPDKKVAQPKGLNDPDTFLKILVAQLKYQDPMDPQDSATFINQLSQMASMEQMVSMSKNMEKLSEKYETARYFDLIGQQVSLVADNELLTGTVGGVVFDQQQPYFYLDHDSQGNIYTMDQVVTVTGKTT